MDGPFGDRDFPRPDLPGGLQQLIRPATFLRLAALCGLFALSACAERVWAPEADVQRAIWSDPGPAKLTLFTVESTRDGSGAHSALMVRTGRFTIRRGPSATLMRRNGTT